ncbi:MAG: hypothetical protein Q9195_001713 [Heterodermia aff. obscurata]
MPTRTVVKTDRAPPPLPFYSQAIICNGMVYCSGSIGMSPDTKALVEGGIADRTTQCLNNLSAVLEEAGSSLQNCVKVNVYLTDMTNFAAMNKVYESFFKEPKPSSKHLAVQVGSWGSSTGFASGAGTHPFRRRFLIAI